MISQKRYINIVSGVGAGSVVSDRKLDLRVITRNQALPPGVVAEFRDADVVGNYFGVQSEEYRRAKALFDFINKNVQAPSSMSFARWVSDPIAPMIVGDTLPKALSAFAQIVAGTITINVGNQANDLIGLNFSTAKSLTEVATVLQTAVQKVVSEPQLASATVSYNTNTNQFILTGATPGSGTITVTPTDLPTDVSQILGWGTTGTTLVAGQGADTPEAAVSKSVGVSNNFGSFLFSGEALTDAQIDSVGSWNSAQNNMFMYSFATPLAKVGAVKDLVKGYSGVAIHILSTTARNDFIEQSPCEILSSINYNQPGAAQGYMYYQFPSRNVTVTDDQVADIADAALANYIGVTQTNGTNLAFYQRGVLCGGTQDATDMGVYGNEMWLKSAISAAIMNLFVSVGAVPPNDTGAAQILGVMQPVLNLATDNGVFAFGKELDAMQQSYISKMTGDPLAWRQVQTLGYWIDIAFNKFVNPLNSREEWKAVYRLIYSKGDTIRSVEGSDVMI